MGFPGTGKIWMNGKLVEWKDATIHIASHVIHYGSGVFEGARCYATPRGSASRMAANTLPATAKSTANYANSALSKMEAITDGYSEAIALDVFGNVSEGSGQNIFVVRDGTLYTPSLGSSILGGITRDSVM